MNIDQESKNFLYFDKNNVQSAPVNHIIPFSAVDGPGNRTAVFLQGCNLDCRYCHNPETRALCRHCGACVSSCPTRALHFEGNQVAFDPSKCVSCDTCIHTCAYGASPRIRWMSAEEVMLQIRKQIPFIRGVTVSGGECTLYPDFLKALFTLCKASGLHTLIDSNGMIDFSLYPELLTLTDGVMLDIKAFEPDDHIKVTGSSNEMVLLNAAYLADIGKLFEIRTVVVRELFDPVTAIEQIAAYLSKYMDITTLRYKLIAYRPFGVRSEYQRYESPNEAYMQMLKDRALSCGFCNITII